MKNFILVLLVLIGTSIDANINSGGEVTAFDHSAWNTLLQAHVSKAGNVNYKGIKKSEAKLDKYLSNLSETIIDEKTWSKDEQLAFWMNAYNAFTVKLILNNYPLKSINDITSPWDKKFFKIGGVKMNLNHIEHKILRVKFNEPRIHFGIVCASFSCPKLHNVAFTGKNTQSLLTSLTKGFVNDTKRNKITAGKIEISELFNWFKGDFTKKGSLIDFLNKYSSVKINAKAKVSHLPYNWSLNE
jgi:hypothetical protein